MDLKCRNLNAYVALEITAAACDGIPNAADQKVPFGRRFGQKSTIHVSAGYRDSGVFPAQGSRRIAGGILSADAPIFEEQAGMDGIWRACPSYLSCRPAK